MMAPLVFFGTVAKVGLVREPGRRMKSSFGAVSGGGRRPRRRLCGSRTQLLVPVRWRLTVTSPLSLYSARPLEGLFCSMPSRRGTRAHEACLPQRGWGRDEGGVLHDRGSTFSSSVF